MKMPTCPLPSMLKGFLVLHPLRSDPDLTEFARFLRSLRGMGPPKTVDNADDSIAFRTHVVAFPGCISDSTRLPVLKDNIDAFGCKKETRARFEPASYLLRYSNVTSPCLEMGTNAFIAIPK